MATDVLGHSPFAAGTTGSSSRLNTILQRSEAHALLPKVDHSTSEAKQDGVQYIMEDHRLLEALFDVVRWAAAACPLGSLLAR
jgi:hypothetical protein